MFLWCFKCRDTDDEDFYQRPKTRNTVINAQAAAGDVTDGATAKSEQELQEECLEAHNQYRAKHNVSALVLNKQLNALATEWAQHLAKGNSLQHRKNNKYGENLYMATGMGGQTHILAVQAWYDEIKNYNFNRPGFTPSTGHFTQVVWKTTKELGVGVATKGNHTWIVCNYNPPGNIMGHYMDCVPIALEQKAAEVINVMKSKRKYLDWKRASTADNETKEEPSPTQPVNDITIWSKYELDCLNSHNKYRALHGVPALKLNRKLCNLALDWSQHLAKTRTMSHRPNNAYGENIYYAMNKKAPAEQCVESWYDEIKNYNFANPGFSSQTGHFTQVVWKHSKELGVGLTKMDNVTFVVCNYSPAGNIMGQYEEQVKPPLAARTKISRDSNVEIKDFDESNVSPESTFEDVCLESHNNYRAIHGSPALTLNKNLSFFATDWANVRTTHIKYNTQHTTTTTTTTSSTSKILL